MLQFFSNNKVQDKVDYLTNDFMFRWKKIERLVAKDNADALLLVTGLDGRQSYQTTKLFNWLFLGNSGKTIFLNKYLDQTYGDIVLSISKNKSHIFITPNARKNLQSFIYSVPGLQVCCPTTEQYQNKQKLDVLKISYFYKMIKDKKNVAVLAEEGQDVKSIEKWPLIQSYALEPIGGTFFTLKHSIIDLTSKVQNLYKNHDKYSMQVLVQLNAKRIAGHIFGSSRVIQYTPIQKRENLTQQQVNQPLKDAVQILEIQQSNKQNQQVRAKVLFGQRTNDNKNVSSDAKIHQSDSNLPPNSHMTIEYCDPYSQLRVCRTYFLTKNQQYNKILKQNEVAQSETFIVDLVYSMEKLQNKNYRDEDILINLYFNMIQGTLDSIIGVTKDYRNLNIEFLQTQIYSKLKPNIINFYGSEDKININNLKIDIFSYNSLGQLQKVDFKDIISFKLTPHFHIIRVELKSIPSLLYKQQLLGSLLFSESFILQQGCYLLITKEVPYFNFWNCQPIESLKLGKIKRFPKFQRLGKILSQNYDNNRILIPTDKLSHLNINIPILKASYYFHENGIRIFEEKIGWFVIFYQDMKNINMVNRMESQWLLFQLEDNISLNSFGKKVIVMQFKGKTFQILMNKINDKQSALQVNFLNELPNIFTQNPFICKQLLNKKNTNVIQQSQILTSGFLFSYLEAKQLMILNNMKDLKLNAYKNLYSKQEDSKSEKQNDKYNILIVNGTYASGKTKMAQNLSRYQRDFRLIINVFSISTQSLYSKISLSSYTQMFQEFITDNNIQKGNKYLTIVVAPFWINSKQLIDQFSQKYYIKSVLTKINASNFYSTKNYQLTENVLTYATPGYSQIVVIDTFNQSQQSINSIMNIVWKFNPISKVFRVVNNSLTNGLAKDILLNNKFSTDQQNFNRIKYSVFYDFMDMSKFQIHFVQFKIPIKARNYFKALGLQDSYLFNLKQIQSKLIAQKQQADKSKDQLLAILYQISYKIAFTNKYSNSIRIRYVKGNVRLIDQKSVHQIVSANLFYKQKQAKQVNTLGLHILSIGGYNQHEILQMLYDMTIKNQILSKTKKFRDLDSITTEQKKNLERGNRNNLLLKGEFFDGYFFRDCQGNILKEHPSMKKLVEDFIKEQNTKIMEFNKTVKQQWLKYEKSFQ